MRSIAARAGLALVLAFITAASGLSPRLSPSLDPRPDGALAADLTLISCEWTALQNALDTIMSDGDGTLILDCAGEIAFENELPIHGNVTIAGAGEVTFDGDDDTRFFDVQAESSLTLIDLTLQNGSAAGSGGAIQVHSGGALSVVRTRFEGNQAGLGGGAIFNEGALAITDSEFEDNVARIGGAIRNAGSLEVFAGAFTNNRAAPPVPADPAFGGAIANYGTATILTSMFDGNEAKSGGAISNVGTLEVLASTFRGNQAGSSGGAIFNTEVLTIAGSAFDSNSAAETGGAIYGELATTVTTVNASAFVTNSAATMGGAIGMVAGELSISNSSFNGNQVTNGHGGAIAHGGSVLIVVDSTFDANQASTHGGAIFKSSGSLILTNSTLVNNTAGGLGGAINSFSEAEITASTIVRNNAASAASGISNSGTMTIAGSIIANNGGNGDTDNCANFPLDPSDEITSGGSNLIIIFSCDMPPDDSDLVFVPEIELQLTDYGDHGGPTPTLLPGNGSPALNNANCAHTVEVDQRGAPRPAAGCDIGAVEAGGSVPLQFVAGNTPTGYEGQALPLVAIAAGPAGFDISYAFNCDADSGYETPGDTRELGEASASIGLASCIFPDETSSVGVRLWAGAELLETTLNANVLNLPPVITSITPGPISQGQPVTITVTASDPGLYDQLSYAFDCDGAGVFEPQPTNSTSCPLDPAMASVTINVRVSDDDGGSTTGSVTISQAASLCAHRSTGVLGPSLANGGCPSSSIALSLPGEDPTTICIHAYTGELTWAPHGNCSPAQQVHVVPLDGPLSYCQHAYSGKLRYAPNGICSPVERYGAIPG